MKRIVIIFSLFLLLNSCEKKKIDSLETITLSGISTRKDAEIQASKKLYEFYHNSAKNLEFYEVESKDFNFLLSYYPSKKVLSLSIDICSGWLSQYKQVSIDELKKISDSNAGFETFDSILTKETDSLKWEDVKTNRCGGN